MADTRASGDPFSVTELQERFPQAYGWMTSDERDFVENANASERDCVNFTWRYEAVATLLWALNACRLPDADEVCDVSELGRLGDEHGCEQGFTGRSIPRCGRHFEPTGHDVPPAMVGARLPSPKPRLAWSVNASVVQERLYALNWLTGFDVAEWDDISP